MKTRDEIVSLLKKKFCMVMCADCEHSNKSFTGLTSFGEECDKCESLEWSISDEYAEQIADEILGE